MVIRRGDVVDGYNNKLFYACESESCTAFFVPSCSQLYSCASVFFFVELRFSCI